MQARAVKTREKILSALERLLETQEMEAVSIAEIAREAGVAVGSVYSHFADKAALLPSVLERRLDRAETWAQSLEANPPQGANLEETVRLLAADVQAQNLRDRGPIRATVTYRRLNPSTDVPRRGDINERLAKVVERSLAYHRDEIGHQDLTKAARRTHYLMHNAFLDDIIFTAPILPRDLTPGPDEKLDILVAMLCGYLRG